MLCSFFFFFQAEDGIRDLTVTGVQTCALPIWLRHVRVHPRGDAALAIALHGMSRERDDRQTAAGALLPGANTGGRSGERRVGEEGRSRGAPDHLKKKKDKKVRRE